MRFRAFPQIPTNGCLWRALEVKALTEYNNNNPISENIPSGSQKSVVEVPSLTGWDMRESGKSSPFDPDERSRGSGSQEDSQIQTGSLLSETQSLKTVHDSAVGFVVGLSSIRAYIWSLHCGLVRFRPYSDEERRIFYELQV